LLQHGNESVCSLVHFKSLNPHIGTASLHSMRAIFPLEVISSSLSSLSVGISSFGFSGTNAHVIVSHSKLLSSQSVTSNIVQFSAFSENALQDLVASCAVRFVESGTISNALSKPTFKFAFEKTIRFVSAKAFAQSCRNDERGARCDFDCYPFQRESYRVVKVVETKKKEELHTTENKEIVLRGRNNAREMVLSCVRSVLGLKSMAVVDERAPFLNLGFDSLLAVELSKSLSIAFQRTFSDSLLFDHSTVSKLVDFLSPSVSDRSLSFSVSLNKDNASDIHVAGIGIRCHSACNMSEFQALLLQSTDPVVSFHQKYFANVLSDDALPQSLEAFKVVFFGCCYFMKDYLSFSKKKTKRYLIVSFD
jgi:acyl carrier protein